MNVEADLILFHPYVSENEIENDKAVLWWSHGGTLKGTSPNRILFLRKFLEEIGAEGGGRIGLEAIEPVYDLAAKRNANETMLWYFDFHQPSYFDFSLPEEAKFKAEWVDSGR